MGKKIVHAGAPGAGCRVKLVNNFMAGVQAATLAEAMRWMQREGIDPAAAMQVILPGAPGSPMVNSIYQRASTGDTEKYFHLNLMAKDLLYAQEEAVKKGVPLRTPPRRSRCFRRRSRAATATRTCRRWFAATELRRPSVAAAFRRAGEESGGDAASTVRRFR